MCEDQPEWSFLGDVIKDAFGNVGDVWETFLCHQGQWPSIEDASHFTGFVITGSHYSAYDPVPWIADFRQWLAAMFDKSQTVSIPKFVGICFGHQIIAHGTFYSD
jgi:GMP synthase-like glutamine amidotransferase